MFAASKTKQVSSAAVFVEDVMSTYLYTGNGSTQTITNNINLSTYGGLVWIKDRTVPYSHAIFDTARGAGSRLYSNLTNAQNPADNSLTAFTSSGFSVGVTNTGTNQNGSNLVSWTFRKQAKFFDVVTYTGTGANRTISHNLGSVPGCIIVKRTDTAGNWQVYHNGLTSAAYGIQLNLINAQASDTTLWNSTAPTSTVFSLGTNTDVNASGGTYVAYLFAHNAGGFGNTGTDNVISCGSYTGVGSTQQDITLGYEPQWLLIKRVDVANSWSINDNMRGLYQNADNALCPNNANAEAATFSMSGALQPTATGFHLYNGNSAVNASGGTYIYIAIRRGPMKTPTSGTSVFSPIAYTGNGNALGTTITSGIVTDATWFSSRSVVGDYKNAYDRLRGATLAVNLNRTDAESTESAGLTSYAYQNGFQIKDSGNLNNSGTTYISWNFRRAPGFFDEVCYTGTGSATTQTHNLGVVPELMIIKRRDLTADWWVYSSATGNTNYLVLNTTAASVTSSTAWNNTTPTSSVFTVGTGTPVNASAGTYVAYLFASCPGVSKVGSYTGNGSTQTINCGFTGGARFVLIKRTDSTGDWYVYDTARGMVAGTDPYLLLNSTAAESATLGSVTTVSTGFALNASILAAINTNGASYIFLAIA